jgi:hypothetical protein
VEVDIEMSDGEEKGGCDEEASIISQSFHPPTHPHGKGESGRRWGTELRGDCGRNGGMRMV